MDNNKWLNDHEDSPLLVFLVLSGVAVWIFILGAILVFSIFGFMKYIGG